MKTEKSVRFPKRSNSIATHALPVGRVTAMIKRCLAGFITWRCRHYVEFRSLGDRQADDMNASLE